MANDTVESHSLKEYQSADTFQFHGKFIEDTNNGLCFNNFYVLQELVTIILSYVDPKEILKATLVCKKWCNIIKSNALWSIMYTRHYKKRPKKLPWYIYYCLFTTNYFDTNLLINGNGENGLDHWYNNDDDGFHVENPPIGTVSLPSNVPEFNGKSSCFATSYGNCRKFQEILFDDSRLMQFIFDHFKPHIYVSEWVSGRVGFGGIYTLWCRLWKHLELGEEDEFELYVKDINKTITPWERPSWSKVEMVVKNYPRKVKAIVFEHQGHGFPYASKMAGGVVKILFDSIEEPSL